MMERVAHRGYSAVAPENTLPAFAAAIRGGATFVEFDVRTTADGIPVVIHDRTLDRTTTGTGDVGEQSFSAVASVDAGSWFSPAYAGVRVPTLAETLDLVGPSGVQLLMEIKRPATLEQVKTIVDVVADRGLAARTIAQSFDPSVVEFVRQVAPSMRRGLLRLRFDPAALELAQSLGVVCLNPSTADVLSDSTLVGAIAGAGMTVMPWTANDMTEWPALAAAGVTGLITDHVGELSGWDGAR
ncbi:glycerophosphodiester phosphodiesterase [Actinoplanes sp. TBRC 11911]|uniref:glycerophosphodiester phosphodiesterase n=1 Tax=Actinoplanes sp. TBRC 11911 TaxID=2729386 RepID=UPI00145DC153|nr:glycerophosphodiester phosphodiesterase family protein [Actinoplanes sp. TBRC 11911]NMO54121.1 glycerophosphodiester phosphodiesterase [Actinoplanes sp. TBRC 11911]